MVQQYVVAFCTSVLGVFFGIAYRSFLPSIVPRRQLVEANGKLEATGPVAEILGPGLAGALVQIFTAPFAVLVDALSYLVSALSIGLIHTTETPPPATGKPRSIRVDVVEGLRHVLGDPILRAIALSAGLFELFDSAMMVMYILYMTNELRVAPAFIGVIFGIGGIGGVLGALVAGRVAERFGLGTTLIGGACLAVAGDLLIPLAGLVPFGAVPILAMAELLVVFGVLIFGINQMSLRQAVTPPGLQGRMNATMSVIVGGPGLIGGLIGGILGAIVGLTPVFVVAALGTSLAALYLFLSPVRAVRRVPEPADES